MGALLCWQRQRRCRWQVQGRSNGMLSSCLSTAYMTHITLCSIPHNAMIKLQRNSNFSLSHRRLSRMSFEQSDLNFNRFIWKMRKLHTINNGRAIKSICPLLSTPKHFSFSVSSFFMGHLQPPHVYWLAQRLKRKTRRKSCVDCVAVR